MLQHHPSSPHTVKAPPRSHLNTPEKHCKNIKVRQLGYGQTNKLSSKDTQSSPIRAARVQRDLSRSIYPAGSRLHVNQGAKGPRSRASVRGTARCYKRRCTCEFQLNLSRAPRLAQTPGLSLSGLDSSRRPERPDAERRD